MKKKDPLDFIVPILVEVARAIIDFFGAKGPKR